MLYLYYGNASAPNYANPGQTWGNNYRAVWHLRESPAGANPQFNDSTAYGAALTGWNGAFMGSVSSPDGSGIQFYAADQYHGAGAGTARNVDLSGPASTV